mmetsp:Transcript_16174/g.27873  ORF Transcript_16174/g.27873 Transcript_16174/m.27873 type:complete len:283 (-) Transcript_16174:55-903(-)
MSSLFAVKFSLKFSYSLFQFSDHLLSSFECLSLSFLKPNCEFLDLSLKSLAEFLYLLAVFLLCAELVCETSSISCSLLSAFISGLDLVVHFVEIGLHSLDIAFQFPLLSLERGYLGGEFIHTFIGFSEFALGCLSCSFSLLKSCSKFLNFALKHQTAALSHIVRFTSLLSLALFLLNLSLHLLDLLLIFLNVLLQVCFASVGSIQGNFKFIDVLFQFLLDSHVFGLTLGLSFKTCLHGVHCTLVVATSVFELFLFLLKSAVNLGANGRNLKLRPHDLGLLLF